MRFSATAHARNRIRSDEISLIAARINEQDAGSSSYFVHTRLFVPSPRINVPTNI